MVLKALTLRCQINIPMLINFSIYFQPPDIIRTPRLLILRTLTLFTNPSFHSLSLLVLFTPNFHGKLYFCIYFRLCFMTTRFCSFHPCIIIYSPLLNSNPPPFIKFRNFSNSLSIRTPVYLALESTILLKSNRHSYKYND